MGKIRMSVRVGTVLALLVLAGLVVAVFHPVTSFEFTNLDITGQFVRNPNLHGFTWDNVKYVFTTWGYTSYYPVRSLSYMLDYELWGLDAGGFKLTNMLLHTINVWLVFCLVHRLTLRARSESEPGGGIQAAGLSLFATAIFAVHPVVVEPVAWVPGREELLMTLGALICFHCHLTLRSRQQSGASRGTVWFWRACSIAGCLLASLSNAVAAAIPAVVAAWDVLTTERPRLGQIAKETAGLWFISIATILMKQMSEQKAPVEPQFAVLSWDHIVAIVKVYAWRIKPLVWPTRLSLEYYNVDTSTCWNLEFLAGAGLMAATGLALWLVRRRRQLAFGLWWFVLYLSPVSQLVPHHTHRADRFLYLPLIGVVIVIVELLRWWTASVHRRSRWGPLAIAGSLLIALLATLSARQILVWRDSVTLWTHAIRITPGSSLAHQCLGDALSEAGRFEEAIAHYETALYIDPEDLGTLNNYAMRLAMCHRVELRDYELAIQLARKGCELAEWKDKKLRRTLSIAYMNYATDLKQRGKYELAIENYDRAMAADPEYEVPMLNQALLLASCPEPSLRQPQEAVRLADEACMLVGDPVAVQLAVASRVYAAAGQAKQAEGLLERAIGKARANGETRFAERLGAELENLRQQASTSNRAEKG